jgi:cation transport ATPase
MLMLPLSLHEMLTLLVIGLVCGTVFSVTIAYIVYKIQSAERYKILAEQNAKALEQLRKADEIIASDLSDEQLVAKLRSGEF